jgi:hypothetical protein
MFDREEVVQTIQRLQSTFEDLSVRGLRTVGGEQLKMLSSLHEELNRIGAAHIAGCLEAVIAGIKNDDRSSARALMKAQASLRVFERILTLETVESKMSQVFGHADSGGDDAFAQAIGDSAARDDAGGSDAEENFGRGDPGEGDAAAQGIGDNAARDDAGAGEALEENAGGDDARGEAAIKKTAKKTLTKKTLTKKGKPEIENQ